MPPRTQHIDDLLDWVPGPAVGASDNVVTAFVWGIRRAAQAGWLLLFLWTAYFLAAGGAGLLLQLLRFPASTPDALPTLLASAGGGTLPTVSPGEAVWRAFFAASSVRALFVASPWFILLYGILAGGLINQLRAPRPAPLLAQLGAACGWYAGRTLRLLLAAAALSLLCTWALGPPLPTAGPALRPIVLLSLGSILPAAIIDHARVRSVVRDSRSMLIELARTTRYFARNLPRLVVLELLILGLGSAVALMSTGLAAAAERLLDAPLAAAIGTQFLILALLWTRLVAWGAMLSLHHGLTLRHLRNPDDAET